GPAGGRRNRGAARRRRSRPRTIRGESRDRSPPAGTSLPGNEINGRAATCRNQRSAARAAASAAGKGVAPEEQCLVRGAVLDEHVRWAAPPRRDLHALTTCPC